VGEIYHKADRTFYSATINLGFGWFLDFPDRSLVCFGMLMTLLGGWFRLAFRTTTVSKNAFVIPTIVELLEWSIKWCQATFDD
jgi:hypothetical protein